ncbi:MAG: bifunctional diaminohydroxyphosphoribosylaminopyrimidine deaminase/5-amino-6-(5-phosphoribosylamino)uracil reductase RibD [Gammaproteobacteria bacterium]|nr:bifunctional diaminohydroxyphosphoribosylaminopyrimidine deaminase/5-amino-6-(5-phosphoribosylamino)uracil reductase RibD [Gammaproteobacteria bacterium]MDE2345182.1 bifunctional diaminohydroxyphosphoribosylaminopyrimidine deaminase/5-amino-6-(5-phosphoribosylamino)uracil reductase RibD [Gammaproteobacteria bacterium]
MNLSSADREYMAQALRLAEQGLYSADPNPRVGCLLVKDQQVVGRGFHQKTGEAHAEIHALKEAGGRARGASAYVTLEPCAHTGRTGPCADALVNAGVTRVIAAMQDPNPLVAGKGFERLRAAGVATAMGLMESQARALNPGFVSRMSRGRPWVRTKLAVSLDGRTALANGTSKWISGAAAREDAQRWRARSSAILTGIGTLLADDPALTVRLGGDWRQPMRVILDSALRTPTSARVLQQPGRTVIATLAQDTGLHARMIAAGAHLEVLSSSHGRIDLAQLMARLVELECNELLVEAGPSLNGALLREGLVDEFIIYMAPMILGDTARGMFQLPALAALDESIGLQLTEVSWLGRDIRILATPAKAAG